MPTLSVFFGIYIRIFFEDHNPPHFHAEYNEDQAQIAIDTLAIIKGSLPPRALALVIEWAVQHQDELRTAWNSIQTTGQFQKIEPLK